MCSPALKEKRNLFSTQQQHQASPRHRMHPTGGDAHSQNHRLMCYESLPQMCYESLPQMSHQCLLQTCPLSRPQHQQVIQATPEATEERSERPKRKTKAPDRLNIQTHKTQSYDPVKEAVLSTVPCTIGNSTTSGSGTCRGRRRSLI